MSNGQLKSSPSKAERLALADQWASEPVRQDLAKVTPAPAQPPAAPVIERPVIVNNVELISPGDALRRTKTDNRVNRITGFAGKPVMMGFRCPEELAEIVREIAGTTRDMTVNDLLNIAIANQIRMMLAEKKDGNG